MNLQFALIRLINNIKEESKTKEIFKKKLLTLFKTQELIGMIESENGFDNLLPDFTKKQVKNILSVFISDEDIDILLKADRWNDKCEQLISDIVDKYKFEYSAVCCVIRCIASSIELISIECSINYSTKIELNENEKKELFRTPTCSVHFLDKTSRYYYKIIAEEYLLSIIQKKFTKKDAWDQIRTRVKFCPTVDIDESGNVKARFNVDLIDKTRPEPHKINEFGYYDYRSIEFLFKVHLAKKGDTTCITRFGFDGKENYSSTTYDMSCCDLKDLKIRVSCRLLYREANS
jgi:hypothetical protein